MWRMQVKVLGAERRRRWSYDEKVRLIEETLQAGETVCGVARRHGLAQSLLFTWRRQARQGRLGSEAVPALVPVEIASSPASASTALIQIKEPEKFFLRRKPDLRPGPLCAAIRG
jgi:transposase